MNERIRELALQAGFAYEPNKDQLWVSEPNEDQLWVSGPTEVMISPGLEKFAELIIRECIDIAYEYDAPKMSGPGMIIAGRIQDHFGLDE